MRLERNIRAAIYSSHLVLRAAEKTGRYCLVVFPTHIAQRLTHHVHDTEPDTRIGVFSLYSVGEAFEAINTGDQNILQAAALEFDHHRQLELGAFGFRQPQAQQLLVAAHIDAQRQVRRSVDHPLVFPDFQYDAFQVNNGIDHIQQPGLPLDNMVDNAIGDLGNQGGGDNGVVHLLERIDDVTSAQTLAYSARN